MNKPGAGYTFTATAAAVASAVSASFAVSANPATWLTGAWVLTDTVNVDWGELSYPGGGPIVFQVVETRTVTLSAARLGADSLAVTGTVSAKKQVDCSDTLYSYVTQSGPTSYGDTLVVSTDALCGLLPDPRYALPLPPAPADTLAWNADSGPVCAARDAATSYPDRLLFSCTHRIHLVRP